MGEHGTRTIVVVWLVLMIATGLSWWFSLDDAGIPAVAITALVIGIAFFKVRLVGIHFVELGGAPVGLRLFFEAYVVIVAIALFVLYLVL